MTAPKREEVESFIAALRYGMKVSHKPEFLIALAEGWLAQNGGLKPEKCSHHLWVLDCDKTGSLRECKKCGLKIATGNFIDQIEDK